MYINDLIIKISNCKIGCRLGFFMSNVVAYADDLALLAPTMNGLQHLLNVCFDEAEKLCLKFNHDKSVCIKFNKTKKIHQINSKLKLGSSFLNFVDEIKYLGIYINFNLCNKSDIIRERNKFYNSFNAVLRKFHFVNIEIFLKLFKSYCLCFYGSELWYRNFNCKMSLKQFSIGFHKSLKKIIGASWSDSNHIVCDAVGLLTFNDFVNFKILKFTHRLFNNRPFFLNKPLTFLKNNSVILNELNVLMKSTYQVEDFLTNALMP